MSPHLDSSRRSEGQRQLETKDPAFCFHALGEHVSVEWLLLGIPVFYFIVLFYGVRALTPPLFTAGSTLPGLCTPTRTLSLCFFTGFSSHNTSSENTLLAIIKFWGLFVCLFFKAENIYLRRVSRCVERSKENEKLGGDCN